ILIDILKCGVNERCGAWRPPGDLSAGKDEWLLPAMDQVPAAAQNAPQAEAVVHQMNAAREVSCHRLQSAAFDRRALQRHRSQIAAEVARRHRRHCPLISGGAGHFMCQTPVESDTVGVAEREQLTRMRQHKWLMIGWIE